jgi:hypothetical protein
VHTTCAFNVEIMKMAQGHLNKKFYMKKFSVNLPIIEREMQIFTVEN